MKTIPWNDPQVTLYYDKILKTVHHVCEICKIKKSSCKGCPVQEVAIWHSSVYATQLYMENNCNEN